MTKFVLGLGAQKAGTTWLWKYLQSRPDTHMGIAKEYHVLDAVFANEVHGVRAGFKTRGLTVLAQGLGRWAPTAHLQRLRFMANVDTYFDHFADLLKSPKVSLVGDITPSYAGLSAETLHAVKAEFEARGMTVYPVFILRDPVHRLRSLVGMQFRDEQQTPTAAEELNRMRAQAGGPADRIRSDYRRVIETLDEVFGAHKFIGFYESLFLEDTLKRLCDFLGVPMLPGAYHQRENQSPYQSHLTQSDLKAFKIIYQEQYDFVRDRFGNDVVEELWQ